LRTQSFKFTATEHCELNSSPLKLAAKACSIQETLASTLDVPALLIMSCLCMGL